ncbi:MAG: AraC family transcriptional regulator [Proteobacteria bacterium]|nr:AraC family transcriptional regulator [Pseudomonadota bacterium]
MAIRYHYSESSGLEAIVSSGTPLRYPLHMHMRHWTLGLVRRGRAELESPAGTRRVDGGGFFIVPPRQPHSLYIAGHSELLALCLDKECTLSHNRGPLAALHSFLLPQEDEQLEEMIGLMVRQAGCQEDLQADDRIGRLAARLVAQPEEPLSLAEMAKIAGASPWHFLRRFQAQIGLTPHAYLLNCRIRSLRSLLRGKVAAVDAAFRTGFADQSHMHKLFKLHHNLTPRQFVLAGGKLEELG